MQPPNKRHLTQEISENIQILRTEWASIRLSQLPLINRLQRLKNRPRCDQKRRLRKINTNKVVNIRGSKAILRTRLKKTMKKTLQEAILQGIVSKLSRCALLASLA